MEAESKRSVLESATTIVQQTLKQGTAQLSPLDVATLVTATVQEIVQVCHQDEARLTKVEVQTHGLADAVLAMNENTAGVAPALQAVRAEMSAGKPDR